MSHDHHPQVRIGETCWPHAPSHWLLESGIYMVTAATYHQQPFYRSAHALDHLTSILMQNLLRDGWALRAWAVFPNHYHFLARSPNSEQGARSLAKLMSRAHMQAAKALNEQDGTPGRKVWNNYWDSLITFEKSYLARLRYVHRNPEHHGFSRPSECYRWCSAAWFAESAPRSFLRTVNSFKTDQLRVRDVDCAIEIESMASRKPSENSSGES